MTTYPNGYQRSMISLDEMERRHGAKMHPEFRRRFFAWIQAQGGTMGVGGGWRTKPHSVSAASRAGMSFHQDQRFSDGVFYCAVDLVHANGSRIHRAPEWSEVPKQGSAEAKKWGLHCNISSETWHIQPIEIDGFQRWVAAGRPSPQAGYKIPGNPKGPVVEPLDGRPGGAGFEPEASEYGDFPTNKRKVLLFRKKKNPPRDLVRYLQAVMHNQTNQFTVDIDGYFGELTEVAVMNVQRWNGLKEDGRCGKKTWAAIDSYALL